MAPGTKLYAWDIIVNLHYFYQKRKRERKEEGEEEGRAEGERQRERGRERHRERGREGKGGEERTLPFSVMMEETHAARPIFRSVPVRKSETCFPRGKREDMLPE